MRRNKIIYWIFTVIIFAFDSLIPALTSNTQVAIDAIHRLGFPDYFRVELTIFKVLGGLALILPIVPRRIKEWAYAGFAINFISASVANWVVYGFGAFAVLPLVLVVMLVVSYATYNSLGSAQARPGNQYATA